jgi:putative endonuclease
MAPPAHDTKSGAAGNAKLAHGGALAPWRGPQARACGRGRGSGVKLRAEAERRGRLAEGAAALFLAMKGYRILARRFRVQEGEVDLVAWQKAPKPGGTVCFVEVKWRPTLEVASESISAKQRLRLARAAEAFLQRHRFLASASVRFDVILLAPASWPRHLRDAWRP